MARFEPIKHSHVAADTVKNNARANLVFQPTRSSGATSYIHGVINCEVCGTGHALKGRTGEAKSNFDFVCRTCKIKNLCGTITFACNN